MTSDNQLNEVLEQFFVRCLAMGESEGMDRLVELDLSISQAKTVFVLAQASEPMPINALADHIRLSVAATGRNVDQLVRAGLLERREDATDRRVKLVTITDAGREATDQHFETKRAALRRLVSRLSREEARALRAALEPILAGPALQPHIQEISA